MAPSKWGVALLVVYACGAVAWGGEEEENQPDEHQPISREGLVQHHTMESPFLQDWWQGGIPYFDFGGAAVVAEHYVRLSPDKVSRSGWLWNNEQSNLHEWEAWFEFRIHSNRNPGADGLAFWYAKEAWNPDHHKTDRREHPEIWGNIASFQGLGVIFDTYDNDRKGDNPTVSVIVGNEHNTHWDVDSDLAQTAKFRCSFEFRNTIDRVRARVTYRDNSVTVHMIQVGHNNKETFCGKATDIHLPTGYYFGVTATTGQLADNHDVHNLFVRSVNEEAEKEDDYWFRKEEGLDVEGEGEQEQNQEGHEHQVGEGAHQEEEHHEEHHQEEHHEEAHHEEAHHEEEHHEEVHEEQHHDEHY